MCESDPEYDDRDVDNEGPFHTEHPFREGFTMGVFATVVVGVILWIMTRVL